MVRGMRGPLVGVYADVYVFGYGAAWVAERGGSQWMTPVGFGL